MACPGSPCHIKPQKCCYNVQITCSKIHLKTLQMLLQKLRKKFIPAIIQSILPLVVYSLVMPAGVLIGCLLKRSTKFYKQKGSKSFSINIGYDSCWTLANDLLNPELLFMNNVHLVEKGNLTLAESIFSSIKNCNDVTCNKHKQFLTSHIMAVSFKLKNFDFPSLSFSTVSKPVSYVPASLSFANSCSFSSDVSALSLKLCLILPTSVTVLYVQVMSVIGNLFSQ